MRKKDILLTVLILFILLSLASCSQVQKKPVITSSITVKESTANKELESSSDKSTTSNNDEMVEGSENNIRNTELDLKELQSLENRLIVTNAFPELSFNRPLEFQNAGDDSGRIFIVEQSGRIFVIDSQNAGESELFLNISEQVDSNSNEKGLLGLAFHPDFKDNGQFFVNYTNGNNTIVSRFIINKDNQNTADLKSEEIIITFKQPYANHNGGKLAFGPDDGYLYIAAGDGGGAGDPNKNSQNLKTLLGKILRIDIDNKDTGINYSIPSDNPFKGSDEGYQEEIYAYGLRNPWRFSFDSLTGKLWAADVGQDKIEEINIIQKGKNYGWNIMEGSYCYEPPSGCSPDGLQLPIYEYQHSLGESVTGGYVYRGKALPALEGVYVYADFITGYIWGLAYFEGQELQNFTLAKTDLNISSFGLDKDQELYFTAFDGNIYKLTINR